MEERDRVELYFFINSIAQRVWDIAEMCEDRLYNKEDAKKDLEKLLQKIMDTVQEYNEFNIFALKDFSPPPEKDTAS